VQKRFVISTCLQSFYEKFIQKKLLETDCSCLSIMGKTGKDNDILRKCMASQITGFEKFIEQQQN
jgi:hypothetical protein